MLKQLARPPDLAKSQMSCTRRSSDVIWAPTSLLVMLLLQSRCHHQRGSPSWLIVVLSMFCIWQHWSWDCARHLSHQPRTLTLNDTHVTETALKWRETRWFGSYKEVLVECIVVIQDIPGVKNNLPRNLQETSLGRWLAVKVAMQYENNFCTRLGLELHLASFQDCVAQVIKG